MSVEHRGIQQAPSRNDGRDSHRPLWAGGASSRPRLGIVTNESSEACREEASSGRRLSRSQQGRSEPQGQRSCVLRRPTVTFQVNTSPHCPGSESSRYKRETSPQRPRALSGEGEERAHHAALALPADRSPGTLRCRRTAALTRLGRTSGHQATKSHRTEFALAGKRETASPRRTCPSRRGRGWLRGTPAALRTESVCAL